MSTCSVESFHASKSARFKLRQCGGNDRETGNDPWRFLAQVKITRMDCLDKHLVMSTVSVKIVRSCCSQAGGVPQAMGDC